MLGPGNGLLGVPMVTTRVLSTFVREAAGAVVASGIPCALSRATANAKLGQNMPREYRRPFDLRMISAQTRSAFVARENRSPLFRIMLQPCISSRPA
jgi:hypothetical protein